jgi:hypothetical protein
VILSCVAHARVRRNESQVLDAGFAFGIAALAGISSSTCRPRPRAAPTRRGLLGPHDRLSDEELDDALLAHLWEDLAAFGDARIARRAIDEPASRSPDGSPALAGFDDAMMPRQPPTTSPTGHGCS